MHLIFELKAIFITIEGINKMKDENAINTEIKDTKITF